jgi:hypothetical protein
MVLNSQPQRVPVPYTKTSLTPVEFLQSAAQESPSLGSQRLQVPGNPNAIRAALASGRFPGVFAPYPISSIYDLDRPDNALLKRILTHWLDDEQVEASLTEAHQRRVLGRNAVAWFGLTPEELPATSVYFQSQEEAALRG